MGRPCDHRETIALVEPWYSTTSHISFNRAFITTIRKAFPMAEILVACSATYRGELEGRPKVLHGVDHFIDATAWPLSSTDGDFHEFWKRTRWLVGIIRRFRKNGAEPTKLVVLGASGPILLAIRLAKALSLRRDCELIAVIHSADGMVNGWRPRNPFKWIFTFRFSMTILRQMRIRGIVLEPHIAKRLSVIFPEQAQQLVCIPHGFDESEALLFPRYAETAPPLRILFLGQATLDKGFAEFVGLADLARDTGETAIQFRAAGALRQDTMDLDQSSLLKPANTAPLKRRDVLYELSRTDLVFIWHGDYYELTPSGVLLDCIGLQVPLTGRQSVAILEWEAECGSCGLFAGDLVGLLGELTELARSADRDKLLEKWRGSLAKVRAGRTTDALAAIVRREFTSA